MGEQQTASEGTQLYAGKSAYDVVPGEANSMANETQQ